MYSEIETKLREKLGLPLPVVKLEIQKEEAPSENGKGKKPAKTA
jgi:hypothetical protein